MAVSCRRVTCKRGQGYEQGFLARMSSQQKMGLMLAVSAIIALFAGGWMWSQAPDYKVLFSNVSDRDGGAIIASLQQMNVPYKFAEGGGAILVPAKRGARRSAQARFARPAQGRPGGFRADGKPEIRHQPVPRTSQFPARAGGRTRAFDPGAGGGQQRPGPPGHGQAVGIHARATEAQRFRNGKSLSGSLARPAAGECDHSSGFQQRSQFAGQKCHGGGPAWRLLSKIDESGPTPAWTRAS